MESSIDLEADGSGLTLDNLATRVSRDWLTLDIAQVDQMFVHENLAALQLVVLLNTAEELMQALLVSKCDSIRQVNTHLIVHVLGKNG